MRCALAAVVGSAVAMAGCGSHAVGAPPVWNRVVVVELFTSQGCSSCPPADTFVRELPRLGLGRTKVVPLTFHVNYWDDLGWKDPFALSASTARQEWYVRSGRLRAPDESSSVHGLYTPQMIVDGSVHFSGAVRTVALDEIQRAAARPPGVDLVPKMDVRGDEVHLSVFVTPRPRVEHDDWRLVAALTSTNARTSVLNGENAGRVLDEAAVVRALSDRVPLPLGLPGGAAEVVLHKPAGVHWSNLEVVAFVQSESTRGIIGATATAIRRP